MSDEWSEMTAERRFVPILTMHGATYSALHRYRPGAEQPIRSIRSGIGGITTTPRPGCTICKAGTITRSGDGS